MPEQTSTAIVRKEDDLFVAECAEVGTVSQGTSFEEAVANLKEATDLYLEEFPPPKTSHVIFTSEQYSLELAEAQRQELDRRLHAYVASPTDGSSWEDVKTRVTATR